VVAVGLSGGVDSAVAALLLKERGYRLLGLFMKTWPGLPANGQTGFSGCYGPDEEDLKAAEKVAKFLAIPFHVVDLIQPFREKVITYFVREYQGGRTPNPCVVCNRLIKFDLLLQTARVQGLHFEYFATGHYARVDYQPGSRRYLLKKGADPGKDQSYFLYLLTQRQLKKALFPLGDYRKELVRHLADEAGLPVSQREESQDFTPDRKFLFSEKMQPGPVYSTGGRLLGYHQGIACYTVGQRQGLGIATGKPLYVIRIEAERNALIVGTADQCRKRQVRVCPVHYVSVDPLEKPKRVMAKLRSTQPPAPATLYPESKRRVRLIFDQAQWAVTPGQSAVFYDGELLLGGGIIKS